MPNNLNITKQEFSLAVIFAVMGFVLTGKSFIVWLSTLSPLSGLLVYYGIIFISILALSHFGLVVGNIKFTSVLQTIGVLLIIFSFETVTNWESCYVPQSIGQQCSPSANIFVQSEDGSLFFLAQKITDNLQAQRFLTYIFAPFVLTLFGSLLVSRKLRLGDLT